MLASESNYTGFPLKVCCEAADKEDAGTHGGLHRASDSSANGS